MTPATAALAGSTRPRARGWIHFVAFLVTPGLAGTMISIAAVQNGRAAVGAAVYCATMLLMFGTSALYHLRTWSARGWQLMRRADHAMIFLFIAGTYTPFGLIALNGATRWWLLGTVWVGAAVGMTLKLTNPHGARGLTVPLYIALGWAAVVVMGEIAATSGLTAVILLVAGGLMYTVGGIFYAAHWPNPAPGTFGYHEVFHLLTVLAAACQYIAVFFAIVQSPTS